MPKIGDEQFQSDVADSIFEDKNIVAQMTHEGAFIQREGQEAPDADSVFSDSLELLNSAVAEQGTSPLEIGDEAATEELTEEERLISSPEERGVRRLEAEESRREQTEQSGQPQAQPESQPPQELSPQEYKQAIEQTDAAIQEFGLVENPVKLATDLAPFLGNGVYEHAPLLASTISRATVGAHDALFNLYQSGAIDPKGDLDFSKLPPLSWEAARESTQALAKICRIDLQMNPPHDEMLVGRVAYWGLANALHTHMRTGKTDSRDVNDKRMCVWAAEALQKGLTGKENPISEEKAVQFFNKLTEYVLGDLVPKISQGLQRRGEQVRQAQGSRSNSGRGRGGRVPKRFQEGLKGPRTPRFQTNSGAGEPFSADVMEGWAQQSGRL